MKKVISTQKAPAAIGPYSQGIVAGPFLYASGQIPIDPATGEIKGEDILEQTEQVMKNVGAILEEAGYRYEDVVKTHAFWRIWVILRRLTVCMKNISRGNRQEAAWQ